MSLGLFGNVNNFLGGAQISAPGAFENRIQDAILRIKQELGVDELLLAIRDARRIASAAVSNYLQDYSSRVTAAVNAADNAARAKYRDAELAFGAAPGTHAYPAPGVVAANDQKLRSGKSVEKLVALSWKNSYEIEMEDVNAQMPLAQQIVSKYMSNFTAKPKMQ